MGYQTWSNIPSRKIEMETGKQKMTKSTIFSKIFTEIMKESLILEYFIL